MHQTHQAAFKKLSDDLVLTATSLKNYTDVQLGMVSPLDPYTLENHHLSFDLSLFLTFALSLSLFLSLSLSLSLSLYLSLSLGAFPAIKREKRCRCPHPTRNPEFATLHPEP